MVQRGVEAALDLIRNCRPRKAAILMQLVVKGAGRDIAAPITDIQAPLS